MKKLLLLVLCSLALISAAAITAPFSAAQETISPSDAADHMGQKATVCGIVASAHQAVRSKGQPTFLNLDKPYPRQVFTTLIWGSDRDKFKSPPETLAVITTQKNYGEDDECGHDSLPSHLAPPCEYAFYLAARLSDWCANDRT